MRLTRLSVVITPAVILLLLASTLAGFDRLAFRDVSHFYTPLYEYVAARMQSEWIPLWNPLDQTGIPLVGETTTAVFYPPRCLLFALPFSAEVAMAWYVALHLILASLAARTAARWAGATPRAANLAAAVYPLSGSVLFLHANPPFLVGAAWLPLVLGSLLSRTRLNAASRCLIAGPAMAMMILGGDPQTALHAMMVAAAVWLCRATRSALGRSREHQPGLPALGLVLIGAPLLAAALSAPQIAASVSWSRQSDRIRSVDTSGPMRSPAAGSHGATAFQFSVPPWHFAELLTPSAFGSHLPVSRRLSVLIPHDGRMWTPTLYMGILVAIALLCRLAGWRADGIDVWSATAVISLLFCLGSFGFLWCIQVSTGSFTEYDGAAGGVYWAAYHFVPGYSSFRYPAKWLPMFAIAASIVTARWLDRGAWRHPAVTTRTSLAVLGILLITSLAVGWLRLNPSWLTAAMVTWPTDRYWGPLDVTGGLFQIQNSLLHSIVVLLIVILVVGLHRIRRCSRRVALRMLFAVALCDVTVSAAALIFRVPIPAEQELLAQFDEVEKAGISSRPIRQLRTQSKGGWPRTWQRTRDPQRLSDVAASERITQFGRWHLPLGRSMLNNVVSIQSHDMALFWDAAAQLTGNMTLQERTEFWHSACHWLSIRRVIHSSELSRSIELPDRTSTLVDVRAADEHAGGDFRFHSQWTTIDPKSATLPTFLNLLDEVRLHGESAKPLVISGEQVPNPDAASSFSSPEVTLVTQQPGHVEIALQNGSPGLLTRPTYQDGHWRAECKTAGRENWLPLDVYRVNFLTQGVFLPPDCHAVRFTYRPSWLPWAIALSSLMWTVLLVGSVCYYSK